MAGGGHGGHAPVKLDPGVESWNYMRENVYKTFKFTNRTTRTSVLLGLVVPLVTYYALAGQDAKWDWTAKKRNESLLRKAPATPQAEE